MKNFGESHILPFLRFYLQQENHDFKNKPKCEINKKLNVSKNISTMLNLTFCLF